jgi:transposase-like protein
MQTKTYTPEFRAEAVKLVLAQGLSLEEAAQRIAMPKGTLALPRWRQGRFHLRTAWLCNGARMTRDLTAQALWQLERCPAALLRTPEYCQERLKPFLKICMPVGSDKNHGIHGDSSRQPYPKILRFYLAE